MDDELATALLGKYGDWESGKRVARFGGPSHTQGVFQQYSKLGTNAFLAAFDEETKSHGGKPASMALSKMTRRAVSRMQNHHGLRPIIGCRIPGTAPVALKSQMVWTQPREPQQAKRSQGYMNHLEKVIKLPLGLTFVDGNSAAGEGILKLNAEQSGLEIAVSGKTDAIVASQVGADNYRCMGSLRLTIDLKMDADEKEYESVMVAHLLILNLKTPETRPYVALTDGYKYGRLFWMDGAQVYSWVAQGKTDEESAAAISQFYSLIEAEISGQLGDADELDEDTQAAAGPLSRQPSLRSRAIFQGPVRAGSEASEGSTADIDLEEFDEYLSEEARLALYVEEAVAFIACH